MSGIKRILLRVLAFLKPVSGWNKRIRLFKAGAAVWDVDGHPEIQPFIPWPPHWCSWEAAPDEPSKVRFISHRSLISGKLCEGDAAVKCARCGIPVHMDETDMIDNLDVPSCRWCTPLIRIST